MAVSVDTVYKTVLLILNKEQRGYITPAEFNKIGEQVQLEIFENYFEDLNQQLRIPENNSEYANRVKNLYEKIDIFQHGPTDAVYHAPGSYWYAPGGVHRIGTIIYNNTTELEEIQRNEYLLVNKSPLTKPSTTYPLYILEGEHTVSAGPPPAMRQKFIVLPESIQSDIKITYVKRPSNPVWGYTVDGATGGYIYNAATSTEFELHPSEQVNIIMQILLYSGVVIRDPQIVQTAASMVAQEKANEKS